MVPGYNHNVKHRGRIYHIQTEDSGVKKAVIITHLFVGGTILSTERIGYGHLVESEDLEAMVRELMQEQHKQMLRALVSGSLDQMLLEMLGPPEEESAVEPAPGGGPVVPGPGAGGAPPRPASAAEARESAGSRRVFPVSPAPTSPPPAASFGPRPPQAPPPPRIQASRSLRGRGAPSRDPEHTPLPGPAPARPRESGDPKIAISPVVMINPAQAPRGPRASPTISSISRPAAAKEENGTARTPPRKRHAGPVFGENLVSDKSLDDVILHYLAEEYMSEEKNSEDG